MRRRRVSDGARRADGHVPPTLPVGPSPLRVVEAFTMGVRRVVTAVAAVLPVLAGDEGGPSDMGWPKASGRRSPRGRGKCGR